MDTPLDLRRTVRGPVLLTLFGAVLGGTGISAPSAEAHALARARTHVLHDGHKYRLTTTLAPGFRRPVGGISLERV